MGRHKMHVDEVQTDAGLVRRLVASQFPQWAGLAVEPVASAGTDNGAWNLFSGHATARFRVALQVDDATWARGRGWALTIAVVQLPYYQHTNPVLANIARRVLQQVLADSARAHRL